MVADAYGFVNPAKRQNRRTSRQNRKREPRGEREREQMADTIAMAKLEEAVFAKEHAKGCLEHFGYQKFHARNTLERSLLLHAFAHMPSAMCAMTSLETHTPIINDDDTLSWLWLWRNADLCGRIVEPELGTNSAQINRARGVYIITFDPKTRLYAMRVIWDEPRSELSDGGASSTAIGMHTQLQVLKLLRAAKALGSAYWDEERAAIREAWNEKADMLSAKREAILRNLP